MNTNKNDKKERKKRNKKRKILFCMLTIIVNSDAKLI